MFSHEDALLMETGNRILEATWAAFPQLARDQVALTWLVYDPLAPINKGGEISQDSEAFSTYSPRSFSYRGSELTYPASVVKLFYLVAVHEWLEQGRVQSSAEFERAVKDMIEVSSNDATSLVVDVLSGTTSGPELPQAQFEAWKQQRNMVNRYLQSLGWAELETINVNQKTWCEGPYGRERAFLGTSMENRNMLTSTATARLLHSIVGGVAVSAARSQAMMKLLRRSLKPEVLAEDSENEVTGFLGGGLPLDARLWCKAGLTSRVRHDAAYVELSNARPYLLVVFTEGELQSQNEAILPFVSKLVADAVIAFVD